MEPPATLLIFDWDDTLLPTTILRDLTRSTTPTSWSGQACLSLDGPEIDEQTEQQFAVLAESAAEMLTVASKLGTVCLITNGSSDWIQSSCIKYLPTLWKHVENLRRVSAKDMVQHSSRDPLQWKTHAFTRELTDYFVKFPKETAKVAISIGDSLHERHALYHFFHTTSLLNISIRSVKFIPLPGVPTLHGQHAALTMHLPVIAELPHKCRCADFRYQFLNNLENLDPTLIEHLVAVAAREEESGEILESPSCAESVNSQPIPDHVDQIVYRVVQDNSKQLRIQSSAESDETSSSSEDEGNLKRHSDEGSISSLLNRAGLSLSKMIRGNRDGDSTTSSTPHATPTESPFAMSPTSIRQWVKLNNGNPFLVAYVCGFTFDPDYDESTRKLSEDEITLLSNPPTLVTTSSG